MKIIGKILLIIFFAFMVSCSLKDNPVNPSGSNRNYFLGFTPYPYDVTSEAQEFVYNKIKDDADIINHHFDDGVPWDEALFGKDFHANIIADWQYRKAKTPQSHKVLVSITPINNSRNGLALYKNEKGNLALPYPWSSYNFNHPNVKTAYLNYCKRVIEFFNPNYLVVGIEVNLLINADPTLNKWNAYLELHQYIYGELKKLYPNLPIMVSLSGMDLINGYTDVNNSLQTNGFSTIINMTDYFAISLYPFLSKFLAESIPGNLFDILFSMSGKPICITETGYPAQSFSINGGATLFNGTQQKQNDYFQKLFTASDKSDVRFIVNFILRDYDKLWQALGSPDDLSKVWRDTGFYDEEGKVRSVYETWKNKLNATVK